MANKTNKINKPMSAETQRKSSQKFIGIDLEI